LPSYLGLVYISIIIIIKKFGEHKLLRKRSNENDVYPSILTPPQQAYDSIYATTLYCINYSFIYLFVDDDRKHYYGAASL